MKTRIISGLVMLPLLLIVLFVGEPLITIAGFLVAILGIREFFNGFKAMDIHPSYPIAVVSAVLLYSIDILMKYILKDYVGSDLYPLLLLLWLFVSVLMCLLYLFKIEERKPEDGMATITGIVYIGFFSYHIVMTEHSFQSLCAGNVSPVWLIAITAFCTDIFAYFGGYFLGKHKLCPVISPKKTIEGAVCGTLGSVVFTGLFGWLFMQKDFIVGYLILGAVAGILSQLGDLTASIFKRKMGIKDYGNLIPGHGGVLDRFDSILFTAPAVYYGLTLIYRIWGMVVVYS